MERQLLVLSLYGVDQAGTRLRADQYRQHVEAAGFRMRCWSFLSAADSVTWFRSPSPLVRAVVLLRSALRLLLLPRLVARADVVLVLREVIPLATPAVERWIARRVPLVWDVDDAVWAEYPRLFARWLPRVLRQGARKYEAVAAVAGEVWAGSETLAQWCRAHSSCVVVVPTVVDVPPVVPGPEGRRPVAGWVGSSSTAPFLQDVLPALADVEALERVDCVGGEVTSPGLAVSCRPWSLEAEHDCLVTSRIGLYPMNPDHALTEGKAGLKAVLYMAHGLPCVVTPTAATRAIVEHGVHGLHATTPGEWAAAVEQLLGDDDLWLRLSAAGHRRAQEEYSLAAWGPRVAQRLADLVDRTPACAG